MLEKLPATAVISDAATGEILWVNSRDLRVVGASSPDQLVGRNLLEFLSPSQHGIALHDIEAIARGESPPPVTYDVRRLDGGWAALQIASVPMRWDARPAMLSLITDLSSQVQAMRDLAESEERYRLLVETAPGGIVVVGHGSEIVFVNPALAAALGATPAQLLGRSMYDYIAGDHVKLVRDARRRLLASGESVPASPVVLKRVDGGLVRATAQSTLIAWHGEQATQTVVRDMEAIASPTGEDTPSVAEGD